MASASHHGAVSTFDPRKEKPFTVPLPSTAEAIARLRVCLIRTAWNENMVTSLADQTRTQLLKAGVAESNVTLAPVVAGSYELPYAAKRWAESGAFDVIMCFGVLIKGETLHFECISNAVAQGTRTYLSVPSAHIASRTLPTRPDGRAAEHGGAGGLRRAELPHAGAG
jgi:6,7-dimethyl-8-ribityllumazine synthase